MSANHILPFKGRHVNRSRPVHIYRNLNARQDNSRRYSIRQDGLVVAHTDQVMLKDCEFRVQPAGRDKAIKTGVRNVHAYIAGLITPSGMGTDASGWNPAKVVYRLKSGFVASIPAINYPIRAAWNVIINQRYGVTASYTS